MTIRRTRKPPKPKGAKREKEPAPPPRPLPHPEGGLYPGPTGEALTAFDLASIQWSDAFKRGRDAATTEFNKTKEQP